MLQASQVREQTAGWVREQRAYVFGMATPFDQVRLMDGPTFFQRLAVALKDNPPRSADRPMLRRLKTIGLEPWQDFDADRVDPATTKGLTRAARKVWGMLETAPYQMKTVNGWLLPLNLGRYGTFRVYQPEQAMLDGHTENSLVVQAGTYQVPPIQKLGQ